MGNKIAIKTIKIANSSNVLRTLLESLSITDVQ
jgi:hypothetical protein